MKIIYDFGANNGDDLPYYLMKADLVVAVEANPVLCEQIEARFRQEIDAGRLAVESCVLTDQEPTNDGQPVMVPFYRHRKEHVLSQFPKPASSTIDEYDEIILPAKSVMSIINRYGSPHYLKIDIEHYDTQILRSLFSNGVFPPYLSCESHSIEVFALLVGAGRYDAFKLVAGRSVSWAYANRRIRCENQQDSGKEVEYSFPHHSSGPYGNDVDGPWRSGEDFLRLLAIEGLGWVDIHATNVEEPEDPTPRSVLWHSFASYNRYLRYRTKRRIRKLKRQILGA